MNSRVYLIGFMGVGKTTVGKKLAKKLEYDFVDTDALFETKYKLSINSFFEKYGEDLFRKLERDILVDTFDLNKCVISTGGGLPCFFGSIDEINKNGISVYLQMDVKSIYNRLINSKQKRPLVLRMNETELQQFIKDKLLERETSYKSSHIAVSALGVDIESLANQILDYNKY